MATCKNCRMKIPSYSFICPHCRLDTMILGKVPETRRDLDDPLPMWAVMVFILLLVLWIWFGGWSWEDWLAWFEHVGKYISDPAYRELTLNDIRN